VSFRCEAAWDSSLHNSSLLNRITDSGEEIHLTISAYIDVRYVCPSVCLSASVSLTHTYYYYYYCCCVVRSSLQSYSNDRTDISTTYRLQWLYAEVMWRGGVVVSASDLQPRRGRFESRPLRSTCNPGQVVYTHVPLFTKQYKLVPGTPRDTLAPCLRTCSFGWCLAEGY